MKPATLHGWWRSWYGKEEFEWPLPANWTLLDARMADAPTLSDAELRECLAHPIGRPPLRELAKGRRDAVIAIDDLTRPTEAFRILPLVLDELNAAGLHDKEILIIVSLGTHRPLTRVDLRKKVGEAVLRRVRVYNHNPYLNLTEIGTTQFGTPVRVNALFMAADLKISLGMLAPHSYAGFSGGGKIVLPGLSSWETVLTNHKPANNKLSGHTGQVRGNTRREEIDEAASLAGLEFSLNVVCNERGETAGLFCGEVRAAFQAGAQFAKQVYATDLPVNADVGIFNAFPKDTELLQALNSLAPWNPVAGQGKDVVRRGGSIVVITAASEGHGWLGLNNPGAPLHQRRDKHPVYREMLATRQLFFLSPNLGQPDLQDHYPPEVTVLPDWPSLLAALELRHPTPSSVAFFPCGPLQISQDDLKLVEPEAEMLVSSATKG